MPIIVTLDEVLARRNITGKRLAQLIEISETQLSLFKSGKVRGVRFATIARMCAVLDCLPGDLLTYRFADADLTTSGV